MWTVIAITFLTILALIGIGVYIIAKKATKIADKATKQVIKETFNIINKQIDKHQNEKENERNPTISILLLPCKFINNRQRHTFLKPSK